MLAKLSKTINDPSPRKDQKQEKNVDKKALESPTQGKEPKILDVVQKAFMKHTMMKNVSNQLLSVVEAGVPGTLILPHSEPLKFETTKIPYTVMGRGLQNFHFIKEIEKNSFINKKIERIGDTVISGISSFLTGLDKKRNLKAAARIIKKQITPVEIMNYMTMTYLEE